MSVFRLPIGLLKDIEGLEVWDFMTCDCSMMQCWGSKFGAYFMIGTHWSISGKVFSIRKYF